KLPKSKTGRTSFLTLFKRLQSTKGIGFPLLLTITQPTGSGSTKGYFHNLICPSQKHGMISLQCSNVPNNLASQLLLHSIVTGNKRNCLKCYLLPLQEWSPTDAYSLVTKS